MSAKLSNAYDENVVKPPRIPVNQNSPDLVRAKRGGGRAGERAERQQPMTLTTNVPSGNIGPLKRTTAPVRR